MKITIITGSPHQQGTSAYLTNEFIKGAQEAGHSIFRFDAAFEEIYPCLGCYKCKNSGSCVHKDSMEKLIPHLLESEMLTALLFWNVCSN